MNSDLEPLAVALKFGFLAVLFLFLLWVTRSSLKDLRGTGTPGFETGYHEVSGGVEPADTDAFLVVEEGGGLTQGEHFAAQRSRHIRRVDDPDDQGRDPERARFDVDRAYHQTADR